MADKKKKLTPIQEAVLQAHSAVATMHGLMENPNNPGYRKSMGGILRGKETFYAGANADKILNEAPNLQKAAEKMLKDKKISYSNLLDQFPLEDLVQILKDLPPLDDKDGKTKKIAELHKKLYGLNMGYNVAQMKSKGAQNEYVSSLMELIQDKDDQYLADNDAILAGNVAYGQVQDAQIALSHEIQKLRPQKKK